MGITDRLDFKTRASIDFASSGNNDIINAPTDNRFIEVDFINVFVDTASTITFKDGNTALGGSYNLPAKSTIVFENTSGFHPPIILSPNSTFTIHQTETSQVSGWVSYRLKE